MERKFTISEKTQILYNALMDLDDVIDRVYSFVRAELSPEDKFDGIGDDVIKASGEFRHLIQKYITEEIESNILDQVGETDVKL